MKKKFGQEAEIRYLAVNMMTGVEENLKPEYITMSRRPGIGASFFEKYFSDIYPSDQVVMNGKAFLPPKYYDKLLEKRDPELYLKIKARRRIQGSEDPENNTPERLKDRELVAAARMATNSRTL